MSEQSVVLVKASVMMYEDAAKKWHYCGPIGPDSSPTPVPTYDANSPLQPGSNLAKVQVYRHTDSNNFRVVARKLIDQEVVLNCHILKNLKYNKATPTFHQWKDFKQVYGLNFSSPQEAEMFAEAIHSAVVCLNAKDVNELNSANTPFANDTINNDNNHHNSLSHPPNNMEKLAQPDLPNNTNSKYLTNGGGVYHPNGHLDNGNHFPFSDGTYYPKDSTFLQQHSRNQSIGVMESHTSMNNNQGNGLTTQANDYNMSPKKTIKTKDIVNNKYNPTAIIESNYFSYDSFNMAQLNAPLHSNGNAYSIRENPPLSNYNNNYTGPIITNDSFNGSQLVQASLIRPDSYCVNDSNYVNFVEVSKTSNNNIQLNNGYEQKGPSYQNSFALSYVSLSPRIQSGTNTISNLMSQPLPPSSVPIYQSINSLGPPPQPPMRKPETVMTNLDSFPTNEQSKILENNSLYQDFNIARFINSESASTTLNSTPYLANSKVSIQVKPPPPPPPPLPNLGNLTNAFSKVKLNKVHESLTNLKCKNNKPPHTANAPRSQMMEEMMATLAKRRQKIDNHLGNNVDVKNDSENFNKLDEIKCNNSSQQQQQISPKSTGSSKDNKLSKGSPALNGNRDKEKKSSGGTISSITSILSSASSSSFSSLHSGESSYLPNNNNVLHNVNDHNFGATLKNGCNGSMKSSDLSAIFHPENLLQNNEIGNNTLTIVSNNHQVSNGTVEKIENINSNCRLTECVNGIHISREMLNALKRDIILEVKQEFQALKLELINAIRK